MKEQDERVPVAVEEYLVGIYANAGALGGELGAGRAGAKGGGRGGERGARRLKTVVAERAGVLSGTPDQLRQRIHDVIPEFRTLDSEPNVWRIAISVGLGGLQQVVVDLSFTPASELTTDARLLAFCKQALLGPKWAAKIADRVWAALD